MLEALKNVGGSTPGIIDAVAVMRSVTVSEDCPQGGKKNLLSISL